MKKIAIIVALEAEIQPLLQSFGSRSKKVESSLYFNSSSPCFAYEAALEDGTAVLIALNGKTSTDIALIGTVPAALTTFQVIENFKPSLVISAGTSGGFHSRAAKIGDVFLSKCVHYHDRRIPIPGYQEVAEAFQPIYQKVPQLADVLKIKMGTICTGDSFALTRSDLAHLLDLQADAVEMEAAAVAYVCSLSSIPFLALKVISDLIDIQDKPAADQFLENLTVASEKLCMKLNSLLSELAKV